MYVCVCHAVTEQEVRAHVAAGACTTKEVRRACGMRPGCGACVRKICAVITDGERVAPTGTAPATAS